MTLRKDERKQEYTKIQRLMLKGENKEAFDKLCLLCGKDTGSFLLVDYDEAIAEHKKLEKKNENN